MAIVAVVTVVHLYEFQFLIGTLHVNHYSVNKSHVRFQFLIGTLHLKEWLR